MGSTCTSPAGGTVVPSFLGNAKCDDQTKIQSLSFANDANTKGEKVSVVETILSKFVFLVIDLRHNSCSIHKRISPTLKIEWSENNSLSN